MAESFARGGVAVITGGAGGIGRAAARRATQAGMAVALVDIHQGRLDAIAEELAGVIGRDKVLTSTADVADPAAMTDLAREVESRWGAATLLMNNAAAFVAGGPGGILDPVENWAKVFAVNVLGIVHGVQAFLPGMLASGRAGVIVNTGSKQGLTNPPGNPAYNTSKAAVNAYTQNLARDLRERDGSRISAHLLIPGWTTVAGAEPKPGAWSPEQVVDFMDEAIAHDSFFILCPDGETTNETDHKRIYWNVRDIIEDRPALSRWHPDWKDRFAEFMKGELPT